jgi:sugar phosphate isomerase/epimerase
MAVTDQVGMCIASLLPDPLAPTAETVRRALDAAAGAGFTEASVWGWQLPLVSDAGTLGAARQALDRLGIRVKVVEAAIAWASGSGAEARAEAVSLAAAVEAVGASTVLACCLEPTLADADAARAGLALLAEEVGRAGATVCVEFLPWTGIPNLCDAWDLVEPLGSGVGIVFDTWHWQRQPGGRDLDLLASIPPERFPFVQVSDAPAAADGELMDETMNRRLLPGDGAIDFGSPLRCLDSTGARPFVAVELFNPSLLASRGVGPAAVAMRETALRMLSGA